MILNRFNGSGSAQRQDLVSKCGRTSGFHSSLRSYFLYRDVIAATKTDLQSHSIQAPVEEQQGLFADHCYKDAICYNNNFKMMSIQDFIGIPAWRYNFWECFHTTVASLWLRPVVFSFCCIFSEGVGEGGEEFQLNFNVWADSGQYWLSKRV